MRPFFGIAMPSAAVISSAAYKPNCTERISPFCPIQMCIRDRVCGLHIFQRFIWKPIQYQLHIIVKREARLDQISIYSVRLCLCGQYVFYGDTLFYSYKFTAKYRNRYWLRVSFMVVFNIINHSHTAAIITAVQIIRRSCSRWFFNSLLA